MKYCNIPIFVPHRGCPFACVFCNQGHITGSGSRVTGEDVTRLITDSLATIGGRRTEAAFFGGSFTGIPAEEQEELLSAAYEFIKTGALAGIRLSTRPDYIDTEVLDRLQRYGVTTIELGVQSMDAEVLRLSGRGHSARDVEKAVALIKGYGCFALGLQMMTGLPGDTPQKSIETGRAIAALKPDIVRIYPTLTIRDTELERMYLAGEYKPQTLEEAVSVCKELLKIFDKAGITVIRVSLQTTDEICEGGSVTAGPYHPNFRELVEGDMIYDEMMPLLEKNRGKTLCLEYPSNIAPKARGYKRRNIARAQKEYGVTLKISAERSV